MKRYIKFLSLIFFVILVSTSFAQQFSVPINVSDGANNTDIIIGFDPAAVNDEGFDAGLDAYAPPVPPAGAFDARIRNSVDDFGTDIRLSTLSATTFPMIYVASSGNGPIVLAWDSASLSSLGTFFIQDNITGTFVNIDMSTQSSFTVDAFTASALNIVVTPSAPAALTADFSGTPTSGTSPLSVAFTNSSIAGTAAIDSIVWNFGDGTSIADVDNPVHTYVNGGLYTVSLQVFDTNGDSDTMTRTDYISVNDAPQADFSADVTSGAAALTVNFTDASVAGSAAITSYSWDFGDGSTSTSQDPTHTYSATGYYTVTLSVTDGNSLSDSEVKNNYITVSVGSASSLDLGLLVSDGVSGQALSIGLNPEGTDGFDIGLDQYAPPAPPAGAFDARLITSGGLELFADFRDEVLTPQKEFDVTYAVGNGAGPIVVSWDTTGLGTYSDNIFIIGGLGGTLTAPINMKNQTSVNAAAYPELAGGLTIAVAPGRDVFAYIEGPSVANVTLAQNCNAVFTVKVDIAQNPARLGSFTGSLEWNTNRYAFISNSPILSDFTGNVVVDHVGGRIDFNGARVNGRDGVVDLLSIEFAVIGNVGLDGLIDMEYSAMAASSTFEDLLPKLDITDYSGPIVAQSILGDVNNDGLVNSTDALIVLSYDVNRPMSQELLDRIAAGVGDVNGDGDTNSTDALIILSYDVGITVYVPIAQPFCY